ncbi:uncharacterized protein G2W53_024538 [Senna tora]|uniref:Uncharacterized protein n=1 Tax=Senna tora TaxID=362788 RepID=A0A834TBP0_9FABA|nr:uncharacterized protein G2W53_024538 [Senna tora]
MAGYWLSHAFEPSHDPKTIPILIMNLPTIPRLFLIMNLPFMLGIVPPVAPGPQNEPFTRLNFSARYDISIIFFGANASCLLILEIAKMYLVLL